MRPRSMPFSAYSALPSVNWSSLKVARRSWKHYADALVRPRKQSDAMALGSAFHVATLEPLQLPFTVAVWTSGKRRGAEWTAFKEVNEGKTIVTLPAYESGVAMGASVRAHPIAGQLLDMGAAEQVIEWTEHVPHDLGTVAVHCRARLDWLRASRVLVDLKGTRTTSIHRFAGQSWDLGTFHQCAFYRRGLAAIEGCDRGEITVHVIAVENVRPFDVTAFEVGPGDMEAGIRGLDDCDAEIDGLLAGLVRCRESGQWPGAHEEQLEQLRPPAYAFGGLAVEFMDTDAADLVPLEMEG